jgi:hypothetical protein
MFITMSAQSLSDLSGSKDVQPLEPESEFSPEAGFTVDHLCEYSLPCDLGLSLHLFLWGCPVWTGGIIYFQWS